MAVTSVTNPYVRYPMLNQSGIVSLINGSSPQSQRNDLLFSNVRAMTTVTRNQIKAQQAAYRQQVKDFSSSARNLNNSAATISRLSTNQDTAKTLQDVRKTLDSYNGLLATLQEADNLTPQGEALLNGLTAVMDGREKALGTIGITQDSTGEWSVDEAKFTKAKAQDRQHVQSVLGGNKGLGAVIGAAVGTAVSQPVVDFLKSPNAAANIGYAATGITTNFRSAPFSRGIFLDLMV